MGVISKTGENQGYFRRSLLGWIHGILGVFLETPPNPAPQPYAGLAPFMSAASRKPTLICGPAQGLAIRAFRILRHGWPGLGRDRIHRTVFSIKIKTKIKIKIKSWNQAPDLM